MPTQIEYWTVGRRAFEEITEVYKEIIFELGPDGIEATIGARI